MGHVSSPRVMSSRSRKIEASVEYVPGPRVIPSGNSETEVSDIHVGYVSSLLAMPLRSNKPEMSERYIMSCLRDIQSKSTKTEASEEYVSGL